MITDDASPNPSDRDLVAWFREVTTEIDETPGRLRVLATRRRELARQLVDMYGFDKAAELVGVSELTIASLAAVYQVTP